MNAVRDWGHAADYCDAYYRIVQSIRETKSTSLVTYVVATG